MKIIDAISHIDSLVPNSFSTQDKIAWLSTLDGVIKNNIIDTHEGNAVVFEGYNEDTPTDTEMLVPAPYDTIYIYWLQSQIYYWNQELGKYNNSITMYNTTYSEYEKYYNRTHEPLKHKFKFF